MVVQDYGRGEMSNGFKDLIVWQKAYRLALKVYKVASGYPKSEAYGLTAQARNCATSVFANIAEGYERSGRKEYIRFLNIAKGPLGELEAYLLFSKDLMLIREETWKELESERTDTMKLLRGLIRSLK